MDTRRLLAAVFAEAEVHLVVTEQDAAETCLAAIERVALRTPSVRTGAGVGANAMTAAVLLLRYAAGLSTADTARAVGVSWERIRQREARGLRMLRHPSMSRCLQRLIAEGR